MRWTLAETYDDADSPVAGLYVARPRTPDAFIEVRDYSEEIPENAEAYARHVIEFRMDDADHYENTAGNGGEFSAVHMTMLLESRPEEIYGASGVAYVMEDPFIPLPNKDVDDGPASGNYAVTLVRFPNIIGTSQGQIPPESRIAYAVLKLGVADIGSLVQPGIYRLKQNWTEASANYWTYNGTNLWNEPGASGVDVDYNGEPENDRRYLIAGGGYTQFVVTSGVQAWADGQRNDGWLVRKFGLALDAGGSDATGPSIEFPTDDAAGALPPRLLVQFDTIWPSGITTTNVPSGDILATNLWISGVIGTEPAPLFFAYEPRYDVASADPKGALTVHDEGGDIVSRRRYAVQVGDSTLAASGQIRRYDPRIQWAAEPSGDVHRVRMLLGDDVARPGYPLTVTYPAFQFDQTVVHTEWINPVPAFPVGRDVFFPAPVIGLVGPLAGGSPAITGTSVSDPSSSRDYVALRRHPLAHVHLSPTLGETATTWTPRVHRGHFAPLDPADPSGHIPYVMPQTEPSVLDQSIVGVLPVPTLRVRSEPAQRLDDLTIRVARTPLVIESSGVLLDDRGEAWEPRENEGYPWYVPMELTDAGVGVRTYLDGTPSGVTIYAGETRIPNEDIADWDSWNGLIRFRRPLPNVPIYASYRYEVRDVEIKNLDLNPRLDNPLWASGAIRVVQTPDRVAWHYVSDFPSGVYTTDDYGWSVDPIPVWVPLASGLVLGDYTLRPYTPDELTVVDIRRPGGGVNPELLDDLSESSNYLDVD